MSTARDLVTKWAPGWRPPVDLEGAQRLSPETLDTLAEWEHERVCDLWSVKP